MMAMPGVETPKYEELCRLCATKTTMILAVHIFENEGVIRQISNKIHNCLPIKVIFCCTVSMVFNIQILGI